MEILLKSGDKQYKVLKVLDNKVLIVENGLGKMKFISHENFEDNYEYWFTGSIRVDIMNTVSRES